MSANTSTSITADVITKSTFVSHSVRKPEYKEFPFKPDRNKIHSLSVKNKVVEFWEEIDRNKYEAPQAAFFKPKFIRECVDNETDDDTSQENSTSLNEDDQRRINLMNQKWTHTLCLFKKRGLDKLALAARSKLCGKCEAKFSLKFSDEVCESFVADYGDEEPEPNDISSSIGSSSL